MAANTKKVRAFIRSEPSVQAIEDWLFQTVYISENVE
jgi:hypothetical protein